jgi:hypothetical protein
MKLENIKSCTNFSSGKKLKQEKENQHLGDAEVFSFQQN